MPPSDLPPSVYCPHLIKCVKVQPSVFKTPKTNGTNGSKRKLSLKGRNLKCLECNSTKDNWMCLKCGKILCGRYDKGHALDHSNTQPEHSVCVNTTSFCVFCYACDEFVINETPAKNFQILRNEFVDDDVLSDGSESSSKSSHASCDSNWTDDRIGSRLRPRKRTASNDSGEARKSKFVKKMIGLRNLGNTCFMNSVLQVLHNIQEFSLFFSKLPALDTQQTQPKSKRFFHSRSLKENVNDVNIADEIRKVFHNLSHSGENVKSVSPETLFYQFWKLKQFRGYNQYDAHEFLRYTLDRLNSELQYLAGPELRSTPLRKVHSRRNSKDCCNQYKGKSSIVTDIFGGTLQSEVHCLACKKRSKICEPFLDLSLDIPDAALSQDQSSYPLLRCLRSFTEEEELAESELYYCDECKCKQRSTKRFSILKLPKILCLHIKRFRWSTYRNKMHTRLMFPTNSLDMDSYLNKSESETRRSRTTSNSSSNLYDLDAVIVHSGNGSNSGHYTSYVHDYDDRWLHFNDTNVTEVHISNVVQCEPYILFYRKREQFETS